MAVIQYFQPEAKANEIAREMQLYIARGKYIDLDKESTLVEQFTKDIDRLPTQGMRDYCTCILYCITGDSASLKKIANEFIDGDRFLDVNVTNNIIFSLLHIGEFSFAENFISLLWGKYKENMATVYLTGYVTIFRNCETALDLLSFLENFELKEDDAVKIGYYKSLHKIMEREQFDIDGGLRMLDLAGDILKKHQLFNLGEMFKLGRDHIINIVIRVKSDIDTAVELNSELSYSIIDNYPDHPYNIVIGFYPEIDDELAETDA